MTRAVLFDLGNTLVDYYRAAEFPPILRECLQSAAIVAGVHAVDLDRLFGLALELNREASDLAVRPLEERLLTLFPGCIGTDAAAIDGVCRAFLRPIFSRAKIVDDALDVLDALRARHLRTAIVSNTPWGSSAELWLEELARHALIERVDAVTFCVDVGWRKPHPAAFLRTLNALGVDAADAVFVGDDPRWDVEGARRAGVRPILFAENTSGGTDCTVIPRLADLLELGVLDTVAG